MRCFIILDKNRKILLDIGANTSTIPDAWLSKTQIKKSIPTKETVRSVTGDLIKFIGAIKRKDDVKTAGISTNFT